MLLYFSNCIYVGIPVLKVTYVMYKPVVSLLVFYGCITSHVSYAKSVADLRAETNDWYLITFENDAMTLINQSDDGYSNGFNFSWGRTGYSDFDTMDMPAWVRYLSDWTFINQGADKRYAISYGISQLTYTPDELEESALIEDDRPYAGTLLWHGKIRSYGSDRANSLGLVLGVVGPASLAEHSQTFIHELIDVTIPQGWDNQISNEPVFRIEGEHIERFFSYSFSENIAFDTSSYSEAGLGNLRSDIGTGLSMRLGNMLEQSYASINPNSSNSLIAINGLAKQQFYWQLFTGFYASYVFNDITLNGNTFTDSHSVELINEQLMVSIGASAVYNNWGVVFSLQRGNDQFEGQKTISKHGSLSISYHY